MASAGKYLWLYIFFCSVKNIELCYQQEEVNTLIEKQIVSCMCPYVDNMGVPLERKYLNWVYARVQWSKKKYQSMELPVVKHFYHNLPNILVGSKLSLFLKSSV
jgi:hypothetical protein